MPSAPSAAFFDLDKTLIAKSSSMAFSGPFQAGGLLSRRAMLRSAYANFMFHLGGANHEQMERLRRLMSRLVADWDVETVREIVNETLHEVVSPLVYDEGVALIKQHHAAGREVVIVSTSGTDVVEPIGALLGADRVISTRLEVQHGRYTGRISYYAYGPEKARAMRALADQEGWSLAECYAYSDSVTDEPMLSAVGYPTAVNPDKELRKIAYANGWPVTDFVRPVALVRRPSAKRTVTALCVGGLVAGGWALARARRSQPSSPPA